MNGLARVQNNVLSILVKHSTVKIFMLSPLGTLKVRDSILFEESDFLGSSKMAVISLVDLDN